MTIILRSYNVGFVSVAVMLGGRRLGNTLLALALAPLYVIYLLEIVGNFCHTTRVNATWLLNVPRSTYH